MNSENATTKGSREALEMVEMRVVTGSISNNHGWHGVKRRAAHLVIMLLR